MPLPPGIPQAGSFAVISRKIEDGLDMKRMGLLTHRFIGFGTAKSFDILIHCKLSKTHCQAPILGRALSLRLCVSAVNLTPALNQHHCSRKASPHSIKWGAATGSHGDRSTAGNLFPEHGGRDPVSARHRACSSESRHPTDSPETTERPVFHRMI